MIILEKPYTSPELIDYLAATHTPVLDNEEARSVSGGERLHRIADREFADLVDAGRRLYTTSENALAWVAANVKDKNLLYGINVMKDKFRLRETLRPLYPDYFFRECRADDLAGIDPAALSFPLVLKPVVGFFSVGVYAVHSRDDWTAAVRDIAERRAQWSRDYPSAVVGDDRFIIEEYIDGDEYAVDAYYDGDGRPVVVDILKHDFASASDVSDRLYYTSPELIRERLGEFTEYLEKAGALLRLKDFPLHLEIRLSPKGIIPIEFNPLRFAGWCSTDVAFFAYGLRTYQYYLENRRPDWDAILAGREGNIYSLVILDKPRAVPPGKRFDYDAAARTFTEVLHQRRMDNPDSPVFGFFFTRTPAANRDELARIMRSDLTEFLV